MKATPIKQIRFNVLAGFDSRELVERGIRCRLKSLVVTPRYTQLSANIRFQLREGGETGAEGIGGRILVQDFMVYSFIPIESRGIVFNDGIHFTCNIELAIRYAGITVDYG